MDRKKRGNDGEKRAGEYLESRGYEILYKNFHTRYGEIDITAKKDGFLCFIEVKTRTGILFGTPAEAVTAKKRGKIVLAANQFLMDNNLNLQPRFDVIEVYTKKTAQKKDWEINHIINAFGVDED